MTPTARACSQCRLAYPTRRALRRHEVMDHRAAPDGASLTARLVEAQEPDRRPQAVLEPAARARHPSAQPAARPEPARTAAPPTWPFLVALLLLAVLAGPVVVAALWLAALTVALWWRYDHLGRERRGPGRVP